MVRRTLGVPVALVSLVEAHRQVFVGAVGLPEPWQTTRETPLTHSFCQYVVADERPLVITDARLEDRLHDNLAIPDLGVVAYAGWPLTDAQGATIGSLCAVDSEPREWSEAEMEALEDLAAACSAEIVQRQLRERAARQVSSARRMTRRSRVLLALSEGLAGTVTTVDLARAVERVAIEDLACTHAGIWLRELTDPAVVPPPEVGGTPESLVWVDSSTDWEQARQHDVLPLDDSNPLGSVLTSRQPRFFGDAAEVNSIHPEMAGPAQQDGARAVVPLALHDQLYGGLALLWAEPRDFSPEDRATIVALASYTAQAVQRALLLQDRVDVARTLQAAMLTRLPEPRTLCLAARYHPAGSRDQVGGDWYDAVVLPSGETSLVVGDVVGHDIAAAATMGQLRSMLRTIAWIRPEPPSRSVQRLDRAAADLGVDSMATLLYGRVEQTPAQLAVGEHTLRWTSAGHFPPLLVHPDDRVEVLGDDEDVDVMLGVEPDRPRHDHEAALPCGSTLLLYTDGLVERRGESIDVGLARAALSAARHHGLPLEDMLDAIVEDLVGPHPDDDLALLGVRLLSR